jgi:hypothetical protein
MVLTPSEPRLCNPTGQPGRRVQRVRGHGVVVHVHRLQPRAARHRRHAAAQACDTHTHTQSSTVPLQAGCCVLRLQRLRFWSHTSGLSTGTSSSYTVSSADVYAFCTPNSPPMHQVCVRHIDASGFVYDTSMHQALCTTRRCIRLCVRHIDASGFVYDTSMHPPLAYASSAYDTAALLVRRAAIRNSIRLAPGREVRDGLSRHPAEGGHVRQRRVPGTLRIRRRCSRGT